MNSRRLGNSFTLATAARTELQLQRVQTPAENNFRPSHSCNKKRLFCTLSVALSSHSLFSSMRLEECLKNSITLVLMCNTFHISSLLAERIETNCSLPPTPAHFYLCRDEDTQLRGAVPGDEEQGDATHRFPFSPSSLPHIKPCHHHFSFVIKDRLSVSDGHLQLLMSTNMEG